MSSASSGRAAHEAASRLTLSDLDFDLPARLIAQMPAVPRDRARLLVVGDALQDRSVGDLPGLLRPGDLLVANDTKVIPAQLGARRGQARIGVTLDRPLADGAWHALARNIRRLRTGDLLQFDGAEDFSAVVEQIADGGSIVLRFNRSGQAFAAALCKAGALALPPYIDRPAGPTPQDALDYQTVFARAEGAVAAPTAGLHFSPRLLDELRLAGIGTVTITLHVGAGTFLPLRDEDVRAHRLHPEHGIITQAAAQAIGAARAKGGRIVAVGTTSLRLLESACDESGTVRPFAGETSIFILPGYGVRGADLLLTNFHLPKSSLFALVCAFAGTERMRAAYAHAIASEYRFYSYGDASLLSRA